MWRTVFVLLGWMDKPTAHEEVSEMLSRLLRERQQRDELNRSIEDLENQLKLCGVNVDPQQPKLFD